MTLQILPLFPWSLKKHPHTEFPSRIRASMKIGLFFGHEIERTRRKETRCLSRNSNGPTATPILIQEISNITNSIKDWLTEQNQGSWR